MYGSMCVYVCVCVCMCVRVRRAGNKRISIAKCKSISSRLQITSAIKFAMLANQLKLFCI